MNFINKIRIAIATTLSAMKTTEDNALNDMGGNMISDAGLEQTVKRNSVAESLLKGELTQEVMMLRDRYYRISDRANSFIFRQTNKKMEAEVGENGEVADLELFDDLDQPEIKMTSNYVDREKFHKLQLKRVTNVIKDPDYELKYFIKNTVVEDEFSLEQQAKPIYKLDIQSTDDRPKYLLYRYVESLHIKENSDGEPLVELRINKNYDFEPNGFKNYDYFIKDLTKALVEPRKLLHFIKFGELGFETNREDIGVDEGRIFILKNPIYQDHIVDGRYIILRFKMEYEVNNEYIGFEYMMDEVTELYENKAPRIINDPENKGI